MLHLWFLITSIIHWLNVLNLQDVGGRMPPIHIAAFSGNLHVTKLLIKEYNANVNEKNEVRFCNHLTSLRGIANNLIF